MLKTVTLLLLLLSIGVNGSALTINGLVLDSESNEPIPSATIMVVGHGQTILSNEEGAFRLNLAPGKYQLRFTHVAYYSLTIDLDLDSTDFETMVALKPALIEIGTINVYERDYDAAQRIIVEAIKRKDEILSQLNRYSFDAYTKLAVRDTAKSDSVNMMLLTETQLTGYWEYPDKYKEYLTARKQSANIDAADNLVTIGEILNFNKNRIDFGANSIVSPTAKDALDYYNYYLLDTIPVDTHKVFLLEIEPKSSTTPLFIGTIKIHTGSYAVVGIDLEFNEGFDNPYLKKIHFYQEFQEYNRLYWMPNIIKYYGIIDIPFPGIPTMSFDYTAALHQYHFEPVIADTIFNEYVLEIANSADNIDSVTWYKNQLIPLTTIEQIGYTHIDSVESNQPLYKKAMMILPMSIALLGFAQDYFHFNRVEGPYLGGKYEFKNLHDRLTTTLKTGYAFDGKLWQHQYRFSYLLDKKSRLHLSAEYHNAVRTQRTVISRPNGNASLLALFSKIDPYDYHLEKGFEYKVSVNPHRQTKLTIGLSDFNQYSLDTNTDFSFFNKEEKLRQNPEIIEGKLRSVTYSLEYDSRKLYKSKGKEVKIFSYPYTNINIGGEYSHPKFIDSDFKFSQVYAHIYTSRNVFGLGLGSLYLYGGMRTLGTLPPQKFFTNDFGGDMFGKGMMFKTIQESNFYGSRIFSAYYNHNFGTILFRKSHIPLIKDIPYSLDLHGGLFWTDFKENEYSRNSLFYGETGPRAYQELGFGIGRLPLLVKLYFTWQISDFNTTNFVFNFDFDI